VCWCGTDGERTAVSTVEFAATATAAATAGATDADAMSVSDDVSETRQSYVALGAALDTCLGGLILLSKVSFTVSCIVMMLCIHTGMHICRPAIMDVISPYTF
jgi:hypothetical protein